MSKKVLILVLSCDLPPYDRMVQTSLRTWDSVNVTGCETIYYFSNPTKKNTEKFIYFPLNESLHTMGYKLLMALEWALANKEFDYIARPHSCIYVNKKELLMYVDGLPMENVFSSLEVTDTPHWMWGGIGFVFSKDVIEKIVENKQYFRHDVMEDKAVSYLADKLNIPYTKGKGCSIDQLEHSWQCMCYGSESFTFTNFSDITKSKGQYFYRVKQDKDRRKDEWIMEQLHQYLK